jgi:hypothetical protein
MEMKTGSDHTKQSKYGLIEYCIINAVIHTFSMALAILRTNHTELRHKCDHQCNLHDAIIIDKAAYFSVFD